MQFPLEAKLKDGTPVELLPAGNQDLPALATLYDRIVAEGTLYPHERPVTADEFLDYWVRGKSTVVAYERPRNTDVKLLGAIPDAARANDGQHQDALIMFHSLS